MRRKTKKDKTKETHTERNLEFYEYSVDGHIPGGMSHSERLQFVFDLYIELGRIDS